MEKVTLLFSGKITTEEICAELSRKNSGIDVDTHQLLQADIENIIAIVGILGLLR